MAKVTPLKASAVTANYVNELTEFVSSQLNSLRDQKKAIEMAAYMKTTMPFYGVQKPDRVPIIQEIKREYKPDTFEEYRDALRSLWMLRYREEKYIALNFAESFPKYITEDAVPVYEEIIRQGQWWDFVDPVSTNLIGRVYLNEREDLYELIEQWSEDADMWIRRCSLLVHNKHKDKTDGEQLFRFCKKMAHESDFFIRKAIGWALREYSKTNPKAVRAFIKKNSGRLSPLSIREGSKYVDPI